MPSLNVFAEQFDTVLPDIDDDWADEVNRQEVRNMTVWQPSSPTSDGDYDIVTHDVTPAEGYT